MSCATPATNAAATATTPEAAARTPRARLGAGASRNSAGYTLQTMIVSAVLLIAAVAASVVLYRAINTGSGSYAAADVTSAGAPTQPHNFTVEPYTGLTARNEQVPAARIRWSPPLYTGQQLIAGSAALLNYEARYHCEDGNSAADPADMLLSGDAASQDLLSPEITLVGAANSSLLDDFATNAALESGHCVLEVRAYTCPDVSANNRCGTDSLKTGAEAYGPAVEHRFTLSKAPSAPTLINLAAPTVTNPDGTTTTKLLVAWDSPAYTGIGGHEALGYRVAWDQTADPDDDAVTPDNPTEVDMICTFDNIRTIDLGDGSVTLNDRSYQVTITPISLQAAHLAAARTQAADATRPLPGTFDCGPPSATDPLPYFGDPLIADTPEAVTSGGTAATNPPDAPTGFVIVPDQVVYTDDDRWSSGTPPELLRYRISWTHDPAVQTYLLEWVRADGTEPPQTRVFPDLAATNTATHVEFSSSGAYNFTLRAQNQAGASDPYQACADILANSDLPRVTATPYDTEIVVTVSNPSQQTYCADSSHFPCLKPAGQQTPAGQQICERATSSYYISVAQTDTDCAATSQGEVFALCATGGTATCLYNPWSFAFAPAADRIGEANPTEAELPQSGLGVQYLAPAVSATIDSLTAATDYTITVFPRHDTDPCTTGVFSDNPIDPSSIGDLGLPTVLRVRTDSTRPTALTSLTAVWVENSRTWNITWLGPANGTGLESYLVNFQRDGQSSDQALSFALPANQGGNYVIDSTPDASLECYVGNRAIQELGNNCQFRIFTTDPMFGMSVQVNVTAVFEHGLAAPLAINQMRPAPPPNPNPGPGPNPAP